MWVGGQRHIPAALPPGKTRYPLGGPKGRTRLARKFPPTPGFDPWTVQPVASRYTDWATPPRKDILDMFIKDTNPHVLDKYKNRNVQLFSHFVNGSTSGLYSWKVGKFLKSKLFSLHQVCRCILELTRKKKTKWTVNSLAAILPVRSQQI
jgi:hypothetical protein